jgi:hypothetical protein
MHLADHHLGMNWNPRTTILFVARHLDIHAPSLVHLQRMYLAEAARMERPRPDTIFRLMSMPLLPTTEQLCWAWYVNESIHGTALPVH